MGLAKFQINDEILKLLYQEERMFIQVIDKAFFNNKKIDIYRLTDNWSDGFFLQN